MAVFRGTAASVEVFAHDASGAKSGDAANLTAYVSLDGAAPVAVADTNPAELDATNLPGVYRFDLSAAETDGDLVVVYAKSTTSGVRVDPVVIYTEIYEPGLYLPEWRRASYAEHEPAGAWALRGARLTRGRLSLELVDRRERLKVKIPVGVYTQEVYPDAPEATWGLPIPEILGRLTRAPGRCTSASSFVFHFAARALTAFDGAYVDGVPVTPASVDLAAATVTLATWDGTAEVTADVTGVDVANAADVLEELLALAGETELDAASFAAARAAWRLGLDGGAEVPAPSLGLWLGESEDAADVVARVLRASHGYLYLDGAGAWVCGAWRPRRITAAALTLVDGAALWDLEREVRTDHGYSRVRARYALWASDADIGQAVEVESTAARVRLGLSEHRTLEVDLPVGSPGDARQWASRMLALWGRPRELWTAKARPEALLLWPGDAVWIESDRHGFHLVEVIERRGDPTTGAVELTLSPWRGFAHRGAWVVADDAAFPAHLGGAAVSAWDAGWTAAQKQWALREWAFVADADGFVDADDADTRHAFCPI